MRLDMLSSVKQGIKQALHAAGVEARRFHPDASPLTGLMVALRHFDIDLVIDIGANERQVAKELRALLSLETRTRLDRTLE